MNVLVACERSGIIRDAFRARGHNAWSCDLQPSERGEPHVRMDVFSLLADDRWDTWDLMIAHPECRYLSSSGLHWNTRRPERAAATDEALEFVRKLWHCGIERICIENPQGCINTRIPEMPKPQYIQPYQFGHGCQQENRTVVKEPGATCADSVRGAAHS